MELIERYVSAVGDRLRPSRREAVQTELRSAIMDALEARDAGPGSEPDVVAVLSELGPPSRVAAEYEPGRQYLIGPELYPLFRRVTRIVLATLVVASVVGFGAALVVGWLTDLGAGSLVAATLDIALRAVATAVVVLVGVFALLQRREVRPAGGAGGASAAGRDAASVWDPRSLPAGHAAERVSQVESVLQIVAAAALLVVLGGVGEVAREVVGGLGAGLQPLVRAAVIENVLLFQVAAVVLALAHAVALVQGRWRLGGRALQVVCHGLVVFTFGRLPFQLRAHRVAMLEAGVSRGFVDWLVLNAYIAVAIPLGVVVVYWWMVWRRHTRVGSGGASRAGLAGSLTAAAVLAAPGSSDAQTPDGTQLFVAHCATCHTGEARAPSIVHLSTMSARSILASLETGRMAAEGAKLTPAERRVLAELLSGHVLGASALPDAAFCAAPRPVSGPVHWSGWGGDARGAGYRSAGAAGITAVDVGRLELAWVFAFPGASQSRSKPAVVGEHVIVAGAFGDVVALRRESGCADWHFQADAGVRGAVAVARGEDGRLVAYLADALTNVYALDVGRGAPLWKTRVGRHPQHTVTGSVAVHDGRVYVPISSMEVVTAADPAYDCCSSAGGIAALAAADGSALWYHRTIETGAAGAAVDSATGPAGAPIWSSPTVDAARGRLYFGTGQSYTRPATGDSDAIRALDLATGDVAWTFQATEVDAYHVGCGPPPGPTCPSPSGPDFDFGMAPMLVRGPDGRELLVAGQKSGVVYALDPDADGAVVWSTRVGRGGALGGVHWGMASDGRLVYAPVSDRDVGGLGGDAVVGPARPGLHALDLGTGEVRWHAPARESACEGRQGSAQSARCFAAFSAAPTAVDGFVLQGGLDGWIRAYDVADGAVLWEFDAARAFDAVGGVPARGGAFDGPGAVVDRGMVFVPAGYASFG